MAKSLEGPGENASPTLSASSQAIMGTPLYLSPEAIARPEDLDARSDLYALGAVAYFLLAGAPVFTARSAVESCGHHLFTTPVAPSARSGRALPADLEAVVLRLLAKEREARPQSAHALLRELASFARVVEQRAHPRWGPRESTTDAHEPIASWQRCLLVVSDRKLRVRRPAGS
jgi:serine/threonine protein kinase